VTLSLQRWFFDQIPLSARAGEATVLVGLSCFTAALPLSYAILSWLLGPIAGRISLSLRERGLPLPGRRLSLRARLVVLSLSLITAPTSWMGVHAYMSQAWTAQRDLAYRSTSTAVALVISQQPDRDRGGELITLLLFALVSLSWAPICAVFLAGSIAGPLGRIRAVVTQIVALGDVEKLGRVPIFHRDELGELAQGVNEMIDRLQASAERIRRY